MAIFEVKHLITKMNLSLQNKNAIICGGSQGIGFAIAAELALLGANCILASRNQQNLDDAVVRLDISQGQQHSTHSIDFNDHKATRDWISELVKKQTIHVLINNSGGPASGLIVQATADQFLQAFNQHLITNHLLASVVIDGMKSERFGRIINIISTSVKIPLPNLGVSNTIRGAVASWAKTMANELGQFGITVNNVLPGATRTQRLESIIANNAQKKQKTELEIESQMKHEIPAQRFGEPVEIAAVAAFLASPAAAYVNGVSISVDGGRTGSL